MKRPDRMQWSNLSLHRHSYIDADTIRKHIHFGKREKGTERKNMGLTDYLGKKRRLAELIMKKTKVKAYMDVNSRDVIHIKPDVKCIVKYLEVTENGLLRQPFVPWNVKNK